MKGKRKTRRGKVRHIRSIKKGWKGKEISGAGERKSDKERKGKGKA